MGHEDAPVVGGTLRLQVRHVRADDRLTIGPRRLEPAVKVLLVDQALA